MTECILCLSKTPKPKSVKLTEKVADDRTLEDAIRSQLACGSSLLASTPQAQHIACQTCCKSFKAFYKFIAKIALKHPLPAIKSEQPDETPLNFVDLNKPLEEEPLVEFHELRPLTVSVGRIKTEAQADAFEKSPEPEADNRFQDSDFEWSMDEANIDAADQPSDSEDANTDVGVGEVAEEAEAPEPHDKTDARPKRERRKRGQTEEAVRYLHASQVTQEMIDAGLETVVVAGVEFAVPNKKAKGALDERLERLEKRLRDPKRRLHPSLDPEGEERIRQFMEVKCYACAAMFDSFFQLKKHFRKLHPSDIAYLTCCDRKFRRRFELLDHIEFHTKAAVYRCEQCGKQLKNRACLRTHIKKIHENPSSGEMCAVCGRLFSSQAVLKAHMLVHVTSDRVFECYRCKSSRTYKNEMLLRKHLNVRHNFARPDNRTVCHICSASFRTSHLKKHMLTVHSDQDRDKVQCTICGFWLLQQTLPTHMKKHNDLGVTCGECGKFLKSRYSLTGHMKQAHSNEFRYKCGFCEKGFHKRNKLIEHEAVKHTRSFPYKCRVLACGKGFRAEGNWRIHEKKAHPEEYEAFFKPFYKRNPDEVVGEIF